MSASQRSGICARWAPGGLGLLLAFAAPSAANAQIDYRNLDDDRPVRVEDAYPVERYAFEFLLPWRYSRLHGNSGVHSLIPELEFGAFSNLQFGVKLPLATASSLEGRKWGLAGLRLFGLYNFNTEGPWLPAISLRTDAVFPVGSLAGEGTHLSVKGIVTRSWGRTRAHLNGSYTFGGNDQLAVVEAAEKWWVGGAVDQTLFRSSTLVVAEVYALRPAAGESLEVNASLGLRYQWTPMTVVDLGVTRRLRTQGPDYELTFGLSRALGISGLLPGRR